MGEISILDPSTWNLGGGYSTDGGILDTSYDVVRSVDTVPVNAVQSMQPVVSGASSEWSSFFRDTLKGAISYGIAKDAAKSGITQRTTTSGGTTVVQSSARNNQQLGTLLMVGLVVFAVAKLAGGK